MEVEKKYFSLVDSLKFGFETVFRNIGFILTVIAVQTLLYLGSTALVGSLTFLPLYPRFKSFFDLVKAAQPLPEGVMNETVKKQLADAAHQVLATWPTLLAVITFFTIMFLLHQWLSLGYNKIELNFYDDKPNTLQTLFSQKHLLLRSAGASLIYYIASLIGFVLFIIPGILISIIFGFYQLVMIDENTSIGESFRRSVEITRGARGMLFGLHLVIGLAHAVISRIFFPALLIVGPALSLALKYAYRQLKHQTNNA